jgi:hypothetical protein
MANDRGGDFMNKRVFVVAALGLAAVLVAGGLVASNMGFKANFALDGPLSNGSKSGLNSIGLPYNQQTSLVTAEDLIRDIAADNGDVGNLLPTVAQLGRVIRTDDSTDIYTGFSGNNFNLVPGEGSKVPIHQNASPQPVTYISVGSHDPSLAIVLDAPNDNGSKAGNQLWSYPYHSTAATAEDLILEIQAAQGDTLVEQISLIRRIDDGSDIYTGFSGPNFALVPGEAYTITIKPGGGIAWVPSHY